VYRWLSVLLPHLAGIFVNGMVIDDVGVQPLGHARSDGAACPRCGEESRRVHSGTSGGGGRCAGRAAGGGRRMSSIGQHRSSGDSA
jgi:hypothetical protein